MVSINDENEKEVTKPIPAQRPESMIYLPKPPTGWIMVPVRTIHDVIVLVLGIIFLALYAYGDFVQHVEHYYLFAGGLTLLGYEGAVRLDRRHQNHD
jgi:hypothetical protein